MAEASSERRTLLILATVLLLDLLAFTCILPLFPAILHHYGAIEGRTNNGTGLYSWLDNVVMRFRHSIGVPENNLRINSVLYGGLLGSIFSFLQFLSSPIGGAIADVTGRKPVLLVFLVGSLFSYYLWSQAAASFHVFVLSRIIGGLSKGSVSIATTIVADVCSVETRGKGMAVLGITFSLGFLLGPSIGAYFAKQARFSQDLQPLADATAVYSLSPTPAYFALTLTILEILVVLLLLPETLPLEKRCSAKEEAMQRTSALNYISPFSLFQFKPVSSTIPAAKIAQLRSVGTIYFLYLFLYSGLEFTLSFLTNIRLSYTSAQQGRIYLFCGLIMILVQAGYVRRIPTDHHRSAALRGMALIIPAFVLVGFAYSELLLFCGLFLYALGSAIVVPCLTTVAASFGSDSQKGVIMGVFRSLGSLARALGPCMAAAVFWIFGPTTCYVLGGVLISVPMLLLRQVVAETKHND